MPLSHTTPGFRICNLHNCAEMRPSQIVNTRVHNLQIIETQIKLTEVVQVTFAECIAVFRRQLFCQCFNQPDAILRTDFSMLLLLHYPPPDMPISKYRNLIGCCVGLSPALFYNGPNVINESIGCYIKMLQFILFHTKIFRNLPLYWQTAKFYHKKNKTPPEIVPSCRNLLYLQLLKSK